MDSDEMEASGRRCSSAYIQTQTPVTRAGSGQEDMQAAVPRDDVRELRLLFEMCRLLDGSVDIAETLDEALALMARHMGMMRGAITLISPHTGDIRIETSYGLNPAERSRGHYALGEGVTGTVIQSGRPVVVSNVSKEPLFLNRTRSRNMRKETVAFLCVPIKMDDQVIGALSADRLFADDVTLEDDLRLLTIVASLLARAAKVRQGYMDERAAVEQENLCLRHSLRPPNRQDIVGNSEAMQRVYTQIAQVASSGATVLLRGESGTGKELAARSIHAASARADGPFISLNCAALPENLIESELFGHERGAFTGAVAARKGRFELAHGGTLFLDEVGDLAQATQAKLLRVLQERAFERLGGTQTHRVDVRIITATHRPLEDMVRDGAFRRDLYYRLNVFPIYLPPLRDRRSDILLLAGHFMEKFARDAGKGDIRLSLTVMDMLHRYTWPGNIRELENIMERAVLLVGKEGVVLPQHLPPDLHSPGCPACGTPASLGEGPRLPLDCTLQERLDELERSCIAEALEQHQGHMGHAAAALGLTERVMALRMKKYGINYKDYRSRG